MLTVTKQQFPPLPPKAFCLSEHGALEAPAAIPACQKTAAKLQSPFSFWEAVSRIGVWGGRRICTFTWKWGAMSLTKSLNVREEAQLSVSGATLLPDPNAGTSSSPKRTEKA